jgi:hypothetical protein
MCRDIADAGDRRDGSTLRHVIVSQRTILATIHRVGMFLFADTADTARILHRKEER